MTGPRAPSSWLACQSRSRGSPLAARAAATTISKVIVLHSVTVLAAVTESPTHLPSPAPGPSTPASSPMHSVLAPMARAVAPPAHKAGNPPMQHAPRTCSSGMQSVLAPMASLVALRRFTSSSTSSSSLLQQGSGPGDGRLRGGASRGGRNDHAMCGQDRNPREPDRRWGWPAAVPAPPHARSPGRQHAVVAC